MEQIKSFFTELTPRLDKARADDRARYQEFFFKLVPRLEMARQVERELDRKLARRFNVFGYLRKDERGLSRVIADLLNPQASHGQGALFLKYLLNLLKERFEVGENFKSVTVECERSIKSKFLDISVEIQADDGKYYCLAVENKPYAGDQRDQIKNYLERLKSEYGRRFLLIYSPTTNKGPSEESIPRAELEEKWQEHFAIMPYDRNQTEADEFEDFRLKYSLVDWLGDCRKNCEVERLRWFLSEAERFCQQTFGGRMMTTYSEKEQVEKFLFENLSHLQTAQAVVDAWPEVMDEIDKIYRGFFNKLFARIQQAASKNKFWDDLEVEKTDDSHWHIQLYRECWKKCRISLHNDSYDKRSLPAGLSEWYIGVYLGEGENIEEMEEKDKKLWQELADDLKGEFKRGVKCGEYGWLWWEWVDDKYKDWHSIFLDLAKELKGEDDKIMNYFVNEFIKVADTAIPVINKFEGNL